MLNNNMVYFHTGDIVELKQSIPAPAMVVKMITKTRVTGDDKSKLLGVICFWFTTEGLYQEKTFNTKDLKKVKQVN